VRRYNQKNPPIVQNNKKHGRKRLIFVIGNDALSYISLYNYLINNIKKQYIKRGMSMNIVVAPDSFKGSLSSVRVGETIKKGFKQVIPSSNVTVYPMADGGEGTIDSLIHSSNGKTYNITVTGSDGDKIDTYYGVLGNESTVIIEVANIVGLKAINNKDPMNSTTYGIGEIILHCIKKNYKKFIIGLGGSSTNDGGLGMLQALGINFADQKGECLSYYAKSIFDIHSVDTKGLVPEIKNCEITVAYDVNNPLCGKEGATYVYGTQKGVKESELATLDKAIQNYAVIIEKEKKDYFQMKKGAGAAGGLGFAFLFLEAELKPGAQLVADIINLDSKISSADWVITGEGKSDYQSIFGKAPIHVAKLAKKNNVKSLLLSGSLGKGIEELYPYFVSCHSIIPRPLTLQEAMDDSELLLFQSSINLSKLINSLS